MLSPGARSCTKHVPGEMSYCLRESSSCESQPEPLTGKIRYMFQKVLSVWVDGMVNVIVRGETKARTITFCVEGSKMECSVSLLRYKISHAR